MATRKKKATIFYPFDTNGKLMGYTKFELTPEEEKICSKEGTFKKTYKEQYDASEPTYTTIEWRPNTEFEATLELQDTQRNGCSSKKAIWVDTVTGEEYEMFIKSILDLCRFKFKILSGKFTYVKMGANFAIKWVGDSDEESMATRKKKATIFYPFDTNGKLMGYTKFELTPEEEKICSKEGTFKKTYKEQYCASEPTYTTIEWRPNTEFEATLELQDTQRNGCSSKKAIWVDTVTGEEYEMFIKSILDLCRVKLRVLSGKFTYVKMGANFAIKWIGD